VQIYASLSQVTNFTNQETIEKHFQLQTSTRSSKSSERPKTDQSISINQSTVEQPQQRNRIKVQHIQTNFASKE
jgi:hypothetical protein